MNKIQYIKEQLLAKDRELFEKKSWTMDELTEWFTETLILFDAVGVNSKVVNSFSTLFNSHLIRENDESSVFTILSNQTLILKSTSVHVMNIKYAFTYAYKKIETLEEEERLIPQFVIGYFESSEAYGDIFTALNSIAKAVNDKNVESLESSSNILLDCMLNRVPELSTGNSLGSKLKKLLENPQLMSQIAIDREVLLALNNSRIIRNKEMVHPVKNIKQTIPYICAISYAYLVILQLKIMMNVGVFEK